MLPVCRSLAKIGVNSLARQKPPRFPAGLRAPRAPCYQMNFSSSAQRLGLYSPENLPPPGPPSYDQINLRIRGYDFTLVEHYMYYLTRLAHGVGVKSTKRWATPATTSRVTTFKPQSSLVQNEYVLQHYERNVQISGVSAPVFSLLLDLVNSTLPEGVTVSAKFHESTDEEIRYVPDYELEALKTQLTVIDSPTARSGKQKF